MAEKTFKARVQHKTQTSEQWEQATNFTPKKGEIVVVQDGDGKTSQLKVGNGTNNVNELEPISGGGNGGEVDLPLSRGTGEESLVIGEGTAEGKHSIAGGTTDKSLITDIVGSINSALIPTPMAPTASGNASLSFGAGTNAHSAGSIALGVNTDAGCMGYYFWDIDFTNKTITLSTNQKSLLSARIPPTKLEWVKGDVICIINNYRYVNCATITAVNTTNYTITVDSLPFSEINDPTIKMPDDRSIYVASKPASGEVELGFFAYSRGYGSKAVGMMSNAIGYENIAADTVAFVTGRENTGAYASLVGGFRNNATGQETFAAGRDNTASGWLATATGHNNKAIGEAAQAHGTSTEASGENSYSDGHLTKASGYAAQAHGTGTIAQRRNQTVIGKYNEPDVRGADGTEYGSYAFIVGKGTGDDKRSNAATIDWKGGAWFAGALTADKGIKSYVTAGQKSEGVLGQYATAEGYNVEAQADYSHAEGKNVIIKENDNLVGVIGDSQGKEVFWSSDKTSFQVANDTIQVGNHALINDYFYEIVDKIASDDDNFYTTYVLEVQPVGDLPANLKIYKNPYLADGVAAHSEGIGTIAIGQAQHVQGKYNLENGQYAHIVGNGVNEENRSNAHTLDWDGNAWYKGTLTADKGLKSYVVAGQKQGTTLGANATAEGINTTATGTRSHAEGNATSATGANSHAEGSNTIAEGNHSHAEGYGAKAKGSYTHAEGANTVANGDAAHAEGAYTIAAKTAQHVQGRYNREDTETDPNNTNLGKYAHIVGNGTATKRSNAHTLDWSGNAWFAGDVVADDVSLQELNSQVVKTINDISAALDSLIIVQAEFSNDAIAFTIDGTKYVADIGMTWGQWRYSPYSRDEFELEGYGIVHWATNKFIALDGVTIGDLEKSAEYTKIIAGANYTLE